MRFSIQVRSGTQGLSECEKKWLVDPAGGSIGRSPECDLVLDDVSRVVSRVQAHVAMGVTGQLVWYQKGGNPSVHNGYPVCVGQQVDLCAGDEIEVGDFLLTVGVESEAPLAAPSGPAEVLGLMQPIPESWWLGEIDNAPRPTDASLQSVDSILGVSPAVAAQSEVPVLHPVEEGSLLHERFLMPSQSKEPVESVAQNQPKLGVGAYAELLQGLGLPPETRLEPEQVRLLGRLMKHSIQGFLDLLSLRMLFKREMRSDVTTMIERDNNPLKFCPNSDEALRRMLSPAQAGYLNAEQAIEYSVRDLCEYQRAITQALDVGFSNLVSQLNPDVILAQAQGKGVLGIQKKAYAWSVYEKRYSELFERGHDPFESAMGDAFREALNGHLSSDALKRGVGD